MNHSHSVGTIITGISVSKYTHTLVRQAKNLSQYFKVPMVFIHVLDIPLLDELITNERKKEIMSDLRKQYHLPTDSKVIVKTGKVVDQIIQTAKKYSYPLILVGHRDNAQPLRRIMIGSNTERLALRSPFPVWIHRGNKIKTPNNILVPCDLSTRTEHTIKTIRSFRTEKKPKVEFFHVQQQPPPILDYDAWINISKKIEDNDSKKLKKFSKKHPTLKVVKSIGPISDTIQGRSRRFGVIAISPRNQTRVAFPHFGSVSVKLLREGSIPLLVCP